MARIEEKSKEKLSSVIGAWIIAGILAAVVITSIVLVIIYFVELNKKDEEKVFEERFPSAQHITFEDLDKLLANEKIDGYDTSHGMYVFVYHPDFESNTDAEVTFKDADGNPVEGKTLTEFIDTIIAKEGIDNFYILNVDSEDNKGKGSSYATISTYPTLLVMDHNADSTGKFGITVPEFLEEHIDSGIVTNPREIINVLSNI